MIKSKGYKYRRKSRINNDNITNRRIIKVGFNIYADEGNEKALIIQCRNY